MKTYQSKLILIAVLFLFFACNNQNETKKAKLKVQEISYFGQIPPGNTPEIFAPGIVSVLGRYEYAVSFSPDMKEFYFSGNIKDKPQNVYFSKLKNNKWSAPIVANFTKGMKKNELEAFVEPNGEKIFFAAYDTIFSDESIWYVNRLQNSWSEARKLDSPINDDKVFYSNAAKNGDLFYTSISKWKMFYAPKKDGKYPETQELNIEFGGHGFISPNQEFILVDSKNIEDKARNDNDIYIYFKKKNGTWTKPINLGNTVNSEFTETCPSLTPDGKYLFFSRYNEEGGISNIYWVSSEIINKLKPTDL